MKRDVVWGEHLRWQPAPESAGLRVGIIGAGKMARLHLQTLRAMPGVEVAGIHSRSNVSGEQLAREFKIERYYHDRQQLLTEARLDAVLIAVSIEASYAITAQTLAARVPCLIEKPAALTAAETAQLAALAAAHDCANMVAVNRRFYSIVTQGLLAVMQFGPVRGVLVEAHEPLQDYRGRRQFTSQVYDNWLAANTIHAIDLLRMIGGQVASVQTIKNSFNEPGGDSFSANVRFANGIIGTLVMHWNSARGFGLKIYGNGVTAELWPLEEGFLRFDNGRRIKLQPDWADTQFKPGLYAQNAAFLQAVQDQTQAALPASDLRDQVKTMELIEQIF